MVVIFGDVNGLNVKEFDEIIINSTQALTLEALSLQFSVVIHSFDFGYPPDDKPGDVVGTLGRHLAAPPRACRADRFLAPAGSQGEQSDHAEADREDGGQQRLDCQVLPKHHGAA